MSSRIKCAVAALLLTCGLGQASAANLTLDFTGTVANAAEFSFDSNGTHYEFWQLALNAFPAFSVNQGDTVQATVKLDASHLTGSNSEPLAFLFGVTGPAFPAGDTSSGNSTTAFFNGAVAGPTGGPLTSFTSGQLTTLNFFPANQPFSFDKVVFNFSVDQLSAMAQIESGSIYSVLSSPAAPVPEPGISAMLLIGLAAVGFRFKRRA